MFQVQEIWSWYSWLDISNIPTKKEDAGDIATGPQVGTTKDSAIAHEELQVSPTPSSATTSSTKADEHRIELMSS
ncbi:hypothetical protein PoB_000097000 [Plakobranchus ocellatus]|uniref:Uncharacterized protein n=1 Tax=Plakobranchus ocellatus TaxID=259542 RepID=A0AAV3XUF1_9GAST|nr:hypothetical protein PoB_000097000 [Plakobranchus ocellatus]